MNADTAPRRRRASRPCVILVPRAQAVPAGAVPVIAITAPPIVAVSVPLSTLITPQASAVTGGIIAQAATLTMMLTSSA